VSPENTSLNRFLSTIYPYMHMKLYNSIRENDGLRDAIPEIIDDLLASHGNNQLLYKLLAKERPDSLASQALKILASLSAKGNESILMQLKDVASRYDIDEPVEGIVLQAVISDRWSKHYSESTYDLILALPELSKVIAISTTDAEIPTDPLIPRLSKVRLEKAHLYNFFNRAHAVRGRRIMSEENSENAIADKDLKPFLRTCSDIESIGKGSKLAFFTPFSTNDGLRLGFFFSIMCKVNSVKPARSPAGIGLTYDQFDMVLYDFSGVLKASLNTEIFIESMESPKQQNGLKLKDPTELKHPTRIIWVVGVWMLGRDFPEILFLGVPEDGLRTEIWAVLAFMNTKRRVSYTSLVQLFKKEVVEAAINGTNNLAKVGDLIYYLEDGWPREIFLSLEANHFPNILSFPDALKFGADYWAYKFWSKRITRFLRVNPHILALYRSEELVGATPKEPTELVHVQKPPSKELVLTPPNNAATPPLLKPPKKNERKTQTGLKCPRCGLNTIVRDVSPEDGYFVEFCQGGFVFKDAEGHTKVPCGYWGSGST
jgi:hypothetical protein